MAATIKISDLDPIASGALDDSSTIPVVDGGTTFKLPISRLKEFLGDSFATDSELTAQISSVNSTISGLSTTTISEGTQLYYTDTRVKTKLNTDGVISGSAQIISSLPQGTISGSSQITITESQISDLNNYTNADTLGFINGLVVVSGSVIRVLPNGLISSSVQLPSGLISSSVQLPSGLISSSVQLPNGVVSGSQQITDFGFSLVASVPLGTVSSSQQISDLGFATNLGIPTTINTTVTDTYIKSRLPITTISSSQQIADFGFVTSLAGGASVGTVSSSQQITNFGFITSSNDVKDRLPNGTMSSSAQVVVANADFTGFDTSDLPEGPPGTNLYFTNQRVIELLTPLHIFSGSVNSFTSSVGGGGGGTVPIGTISSSQQITEFGFISASVTTIPQGTVSSSQQIIDLGFVTDASIGTTISTNVTATYVKNRLPENTVSASAQLSADFAVLGGATGFTNTSSSLATRVSTLEGGAGITSGLVSSSDQVNYLAVQNQLTFEATGSLIIFQNGSNVEISSSAVSYPSLTNIPLGIVSGTLGISNLGFVDTNAVDAAITSFSSSLTNTINEIISDILEIEGNYAWTGSNSFVGNQLIFGDLSASGSITADSFIVGGVGTPILESATNLDISASADINIFSENMIVSASVDIGDTLKLKSWNPLPAGELGMLAVSASIAGVGGLYFYNGTIWQSVDLT